MLGQTHQNAALKASLVNSKELTQKDTALKTFDNVQTRWNKQKNLVIGEANRPFLGILLNSKSVP